MHPVNIVLELKLIAVIYPWWNWLPDTFTIYEVLGVMILNLLSQAATICFPFYVNWKLDIY